MSDALKKARGDSLRLRSGDIPTEALTKPVTGTPRRTWRIVAAASVIVFAIAVATWLFVRRQNIERARASLANVERLSEQARYFEAWDLAQSLHPILGNDERLSRALQKMSEELTVTSTPAGANVYLQRLLPNGSDGPRELVGTTPLPKRPIARGNYILIVAKDGYAERVRPLNTQPLRVMQHVLPQPPPPIDVKLLRSNEVPARMVHVDGGPYALTGWSRISDEKVPLDPFFIDRYEVSNREFEQFVRAGGYRRRELWKEPFVKDGTTLSFDEAMALFHDTTGLHGPRNWAQGKYPPGLENHPVTDITWYEAAAYAELAGKKLPTAFQWDKAARNGMRAWTGHIFPWGMVESGADITPRANFRGAGPMPVDSLAAGMSVWGAYHLAGNVAEMLRNRVDDGVGATGGGFDDATYQFGEVASYPRFFSSPKLGFRCVRETTTRSGDQGAFALVTARERPRIPPSASDAEFARLRRAYDYARTPLEMKVIDRTESADWIREKVTYRGALDKTAIAYLYLPKGVRPPYRVVHFVPAGDVSRGLRTLPMSIESTVGGLIRGGRAVFGVVLEGYLERNASRGNGVVEDVIDLRRGLDVLAARPDVDSASIGFLNPSAALVGYAVTALDDRYDAVALIGSSFIPIPGEAPRDDQVDFLPRIRASKLVIHGKYDEVNPLSTDGQVVFDLMRGEKELLAYDGGHVPSNDWVMPRLIAWYDKVLGPVRS